jgi:hypothetical protein
MNAYNEAMARERLAWEEGAKSELAYIEKTGFLKKQVDSASSKLGLSMTPLVK